MEHGDYLIDLVDPQGNVIGQKPRREVDKIADHYHTVHVLMVTPQAELVLGGLPKRADLPNIYAHRLSTTVATIRRHGETPGVAAVRALKRELFMDDARVKLLGEDLLTVEPGREAYITAYFLIAEPPTAYSTIDIEGLKTISADQFDEVLRENPGRFAPTLLAIWKRYHKQLPL